MAISGVKTLASALFSFGKQRMHVVLVRKAGAKAYGVHVTVRTASLKEGGKVTTSGYTALAEDEKQAHEDFDWACDEARKKGWEPGPKRGCGRVRMLSGVPAPVTKVEAPPASRLMTRQTEALRKRA